jgi:hypothetical protein
MAKLINVVAVEGNVLSDVSTEAIREVFCLINSLADLIFVLAFYVLPSCGLSLIMQYKYYWRLRNCVVIYRFIRIYVCINP